MLTLLNENCKAVRLYCKASGQLYTPWAIFFKPVGCMHVRAVAQNYICHNTSRVLFPERVSPVQKLVCYSVWMPDCEFVFFVLRDDCLC